MTLKIMTLSQSEEWDRIVRSFEAYDVYWLSGYVKAFELHGDGVPLLFYYEDEVTRGINVVMKRDVSDDIHFKKSIARNTYFDFASPYGYGGWIIEGEHTGKLFLSYENWCINNNIVSEFVRFHPIVENSKYCSDAYNIIPLGNTIAMDISSPEIIWKNLHSKNKNMIRKAIKNGVVIYSGRYPEIYQNFREIYNQTMDKDNAAEYYYFSQDFYESILYDLSKNAHVFYAEYEHEVIAAAIMIYANGFMNYHLSGSIKEYSNLAPSNLLLYEAALWGNANGYKSLYLGGGVGSGEDGLYKFKKSFYKPDDARRFHIGKKVFNRKKYNELLRIRGEVEREYFPEYRA